MLNSYYRILCWIQAGWRSPWSKGTLIPPLPQIKPQLFHRHRLKKKPHIGLSSPTQEIEFGGTLQAPSLFSLYLPHSTLSLPSLDTGMALPHLSKAFPTLSTYLLSVSGWAPSGASGAAFAAPAVGHLGSDRLPISLQFSPLVELHLTNFKKHIFFGEVCFKIIYS